MSTDHRVEAPSDILLMSTNGAGLGHLTRSLAIGRRLQPSARPVVFTLSSAVRVARSLGFFVEHMQDHRYAWSGKEWDGAFRARLRALLEHHQPRVVVFDGASLPRHLLAATEASGVPLVWCRRGLRQKDRALPRDARRVHSVIEPSDLADSPSTTRARVVPVPPIVFGTREDLLPRPHAAVETAVDPDAFNVLVQLGAGNTYSLDRMLRPCLDALAGRDVSVTVAVSPIARTILELPDHVQVLRRYPLTPVYPAFDLVITSAGYNAVHEVAAFGVPALLVPNRQIALDDQPARARGAERLGFARTWLDDDERALGRIIDELMRQETRDSLTEASRRLGLQNGAEAAARHIGTLAA